MATLDLVGPGVHHVDLREESKFPTWHQIVSVSRKGGHLNYEILLTRCCPGRYFSPISCNFQMRWTVWCNSKRTFLNSSVLPKFNPDSTKSHFIYRVLPMQWARIKRCQDRNRSNGWYECTTSTRTRETDESARRLMEWKEKGRTKRRETKGRRTFAKYLDGQG